MCKCVDILDRMVKEGIFWEIIFGLGLGWGISKCYGWGRSKFNMLEEKRKSVCLKLSEWRESGRDEEKSR